MAIIEHYDEIAKCNKCGFCQAACPVFRSTGREAGVARGRLALLRAIIENRLDWSKELEAPLFNCLLCNACTANCFPAIPTSELVIKARSEYLKKVGKKSIHNLLFDKLLPYPNRLHLAARAAALGKNTGMADLAEALGLLKIFGPDFAHANKVIGKIPSRAFRDRNKDRRFQGDGQNLRIGYFVGCGVDIITQDAGEATLGFLKKIGKTKILDNCCCGLPAWSYGDLEAARRLAEKNLQIINAEDYDLIVTDCSSCAAFLKNYPALFAGETQIKKLADEFSSKIKDFTELANLATIGDVSIKPEITVTYHDPCHASRGQGLVSEPREMLNHIPGVKYIELPEADWCCGGAGSYALANFELAAKVLERKMMNVKQTGAEVVATSCPSCMIYLAHGARTHGLDVKVKHISEIIQNGARLKE